MKIGKTTIKVMFQVLLVIGWEAETGGREPEHTDAWMCNNTDGQLQRGRMRGWTKRK